MKKLLCSVFGFWEIVALKVQHKHFKVKEAYSKFNIVIIMVND